MAIDQRPGRLQRSRLVRRDSRHLRQQPQLQTREGSPSRTPQELLDAAREEFRCLGDLPERQQRQQPHGSAFIEHFVATRLHLLLNECCWLRFFMEPSEVKSLVCLAFKGALQDNRGLKGVRVEAFSKALEDAVRNDLQNVVFEHHPSARYSDQEVNSELIFSFLSHLAEANCSRREVDTLLSQLACSQEERDLMYTISPDQISNPDLLRSTPPTPAEPGPLLPSPTRLKLCFN